MSFLEYYFPGTLILILLFTAIFATISIIEDRREGFLQSVLVAPIPRWSMVLGEGPGRNADRGRPRSVFSHPLAGSAGRSGTCPLSWHWLPCCS